MPDAGDAAPMEASVEDLEQAHHHLINHREEILASETCGCFYCRHIFPPARIGEWIDEVGEAGGQTAMCPHCGIDSVIGSASGFPITEEFLRRMKRYWF